MSFFSFRQNNSGSTWGKPAVNVIVEASSVEEACSRTEPHFTLCGDSGLYSEYDSCGCCPCCGHRWGRPWSDDPDKLEGLLADIDRYGLAYMGGVGTALVKHDGSIIVGDSFPNLTAIRDYIKTNH